MSNHEKSIEQFVPTTSMNNLIFDYLLNNGHVSVALALKNDIERTKYANCRDKIELTDESNIREQVLCFPKGTVSILSKSDSRQNPSWRDQRSGENH